VKNKPERYMLMQPEGASKPYMVPDPDGNWTPFVQSAQKRVELDVAGQPKLELTVLERKAIDVLNNLKAACDGGLIKLPVDMQMGIDVVLTMATVRRIGVK
jgi:hypothetical protein